MRKFGRKYSFSIADLASIASGIYRRDSFSGLVIENVQKSMTMLILLRQNSFILCLLFHYPDQFCMSSFKQTNKQRKNTTKQLSSFCKDIYFTHAVNENVLSCSNLTDKTG